jgi:chitinase
MKISIIILLVVGFVCIQSLPVSIFYCGFGGDYCGQSSTDDVNPNVKFVILAFANPQSDGTVIVDDANFPTKLVSSWQASGKKVLISVGGQNGNWGFVFATTANTANFVNSLENILTQYGLDGVDLDIESYLATPRTVANAIISLRQAIGNKLIIVSPEDVAVIQTVGYVPTPDAAGQPWNYFVPIVNLADAAIDFYQPQAYNNGYDSFAGGSEEYLQDVYLNWCNLPAAGQPITGYNGINGSKLLIGLEASTSAGGSSFYASADTITKFKSWISTNGFPLEGFMIWDSHWDALNSYAVSTACSS